MFVIVQVFWSPATIVPVQSADKVTVKPATTRPVSVTLNAPGPNVTRVPFTLAGNVGGSYSGVVLSISTTFNINPSNQGMQLCIE